MGIMSTLLEQLQHYTLNDQSTLRSSLPYDLRAE